MLKQVQLHDLIAIPIQQGIINTLGVSQWDPPSKYNPIPVETAKLKMDFLIDDEIESESNAEENVDMHVIDQIEALKELRHKAESKMEDIRYLRANIILFVVITVIRSALILNKCDVSNEEDAVTQNKLESPIISMKDHISPKPKKMVFPFINILHPEF